MNRAQRREAAKAKPRKAMNKSAAWIAIQKTLYSASHDDLMTDDVTEVLARPYATLDRLVHKDVDDNDFIDLNEAIIAGFCLAAEMHKAATNFDAKFQIGLSQPHFEAAAEALAEMGARKNRTGKYRPTGDELKLIREGLGWYSELLPLATRGLVLRALIRAEKMVTEKLKETAK